jgi:hypothetical protein
VERAQSRNQYLQQRDRYLKRLRKLLSRLPKADWLFAAWVIDRGFSNKGFRQPPGFNYPQQYLTAAMDEPGAVRGWEIETLTTECLACPIKSGPRTLDVRNWPAIAEIVTLLRDIGNAETGMTEPEAVLRNVRRIISQQIPWQVHSHTIEDYVRWWSIFQSEKLQVIFEARMGVSLRNFIVMGFAWCLVLKENSFLPYPNAEDAFRVTSNDIAAFVKGTCMSLAEAVAGAKEIVATGAEIDFRRSNLRQKPVIMLGKNEQFICPIWQPFLWRITSGLYYDVVGDVRAPHEIGKQYEIYTQKLMSAVAVELQVIGEINFGTAKKPKLSPDCIIHRAGAVEMLIECKAKKMPQVAQHSMIETKERVSAIEELAKGVVQLCRFEIALLQSMVTELRTSDDIVLLLVTLDDWVFTGPDITNSVFERAAEIASTAGECFPRIEARQITFSTATELDELCSHYNFHDIKRICAACTEDKYRDYAVVSVAREAFKKERFPKNYPLAHLLDSLVDIPLGNHVDDEDTLSP